MKQWLTEDIVRELWPPDRAISDSLVGAALSNAMLRGGALDDWSNDGTNACVHFPLGQARSRLRDFLRVNAPIDFQARPWERLERVRPEEYYDYPYRNNTGLKSGRVIRGANSG